MSRLRTIWGHGKPVLVPAALYLLVLCAVFWRLWTPIDGGARAFGWDSVWEYWGDLQFQADSWANGDFPLWNPLDRGGYPFHADPQAGVLYPVTWVLVAMAWLLGHTPWWLIAVKILFHFWLACMGLHLLVRRRGVPEIACYVGGAVFLLSYAVTQNLFSALNWNIAWAPWCMLAIDRWAERPRWGRAAVVALAMGMCALAGAPGSFWYSLLVIVPYGAWAVVSAARASEDRRGYLRQAAVTTAAAAALFGVMVFAQFASTAALVGNSVRSSRDLEFIAFSTFGADDIAGFVIPRNVGGNTYVGVATVLWIGILLSTFYDPRRVVLACIAAFGVLMALGSQGAFLPFTASAFPAFGFYRRAHRYLYVAQLAIAILGAEGLGAILRAESEALRRRVRTGVLVIGAIAFTVFAIGYVVKATEARGPQQLRDAFALACVAVVFATWITYMLLRTTGRWRMTFAVIAVVGATCDLWFAQAVRIDDGMHAIPKTPHDKFVRGLDGVPSEVRIYDREYAKYRPGIRLGVRDFGGYEDDPLALARFAELRDAVAKAPRALGHANVRYLLESGRKKSRKTAADKAALRSIRSGVFEVNKVAPTVFWVDRGTVVEQRGQVWPALLAAEPGTIAVLERGTVPAAVEVPTGATAGIPRSVPGRVVRRGRNELIVEVDAPARGVVVVTEAYYPGWTALVDGESAAIMPTNLMFRGIVVGPGMHRIQMRYEPTAYRALAAFSVLAMLAAIGLIVWDRRRHA